MFHCLQRHLLGRDGHWASQPHLLKKNPCHRHDRGVPLSHGGEKETRFSMAIVSWNMIKKLVPRVSKSHLKYRHINLWDYQGNSIPVIRSGIFQISFKNFVFPLRLILVDGSLPSLLGLDWFSPLGVTGINFISNPDIEARNFPMSLKEIWASIRAHPSPSTLTPRLPWYEWSHTGRHLNYVQG